MKYNLTFWQRLELIPVRILWLQADPDKRVSWHLLKKGMEKHKHNYVIPIREGSITLYKCDWEGCNQCIDVTL